MKNTLSYYHISYYSLFLSYIFEYSFLQASKPTYHQSKEQTKTTTSSVERLFHCIVTIQRDDWTIVIRWKTPYHIIISLTIHCFFHIYLNIHFHRQVNLPITIETSRQRQPHSRLNDYFIALWLYSATTERQWLNEKYLIILSYLLPFTVSFISIQT